MFLTVVSCWANVNARANVSAHLESSGLLPVKFWGTLWVLFLCLIQIDFKPKFVLGDKNMSEVFFEQFLQKSLKRDPPAENIFCRNLLKKYVKLWELYWACGLSIRTVSG
jgi:hypothetical protein